MISFLTSLFGGSLWKIATGGAALISVVLVGLLTASYFENRDLMTQRTVLMRQIDDPKTGYVAQLSQAHTNEATYSAAIIRQNEAYNKLSAESKTALANSQAALAASQTERKTLETKLSRFLSTGPKGDTLEDRIRDIDSRAMMEFLG